MRPDTRTDRHQLSAGLLRPLVLVSLSTHPAYGDELRARLDRIGLPCGQGSKSRTLNVLEEEGLLTSSWERSSTGPTRRRYALTDAGARMVDAYVEAIGQLASVAQAFFDLRSRRHDPPLRVAGADHRLRAASVAG